MSIDKKHIAILILVVISGMWYANKLISQNSNIQRNISNQSKILEDMQELPSNDKSISQYFSNIDIICAKQPINIDIITEELGKAGLDSANDRIEIRHSETEKIGPYNMETYTVDVKDLSPKKVGQLLATAAYLSKRTPSVTLRQNKMVDAEIEIYDISREGQSD